MNDVILRVNGVDFGGWLSVDISAGIERVARDFSLSVTRSWPGETTIPRRIRPGDVCELFIGADKLLTGYVDATPVRYDSGQVSVSVTGRSKTADMVDCAAIHKTGQWRGAHVESIAADLAAVYGITVFTDINTGAVLPEHQVQPGETAFECIDRILSLTQLLATDDALGRLVFISAGSGGRAATALKTGENILSADAALDYKDVFTEYTVKGQKSGNDYDTGATVAELSATAKNSIFSRRRVMQIKQDGQATAAICIARADYENKHRQAKALMTTYTVQGWRQGNGDLWLPNQTVRVTDPVIGFDEDLLIAEVSYKLSESGTTTTLKVAPVAGFISPPDAEKAAKKAKVQGDKWADVKAK